MTAKRGFVGRNTWSKRYNCFRNGPIPFLLIKWCPKWLHWGGSTLLSTPFKRRRYCKMCPDFRGTMVVEHCHHSTKGIPLQVEKRCSPCALSASTFHR